jgi:uncharacterized membrane protein
MFDGTHMDGGWWVVMSLFWILLAVVIVWAVAVLARRGGDEGRPHEKTPQERTPQERLDQRLADGEIDIETYDELDRRLRRGRDLTGAES